MASNRSVVNRLAGPELHVSPNHRVLNSQRSHQSSSAADAAEDARMISVDTCSSHQFGWNGPPGSKTHVPTAKCNHVHHHHGPIEIEPEPEPEPEPIVLPPPPSPPPSPPSKPPPKPPLNPPPVRAKVKPKFHLTGLAALVIVVFATLLAILFSRVLPVEEEFEFDDEPELPSLPPWPSYDLIIPELRKSSQIRQMVVDFLQEKTVHVDEQQLERLVKGTARRNAHDNLSKNKFLSMFHASPDSSLILDYIDELLILQQEKLITEVDQHMTDVTESIDTLVGQLGNIQAMLDDPELVTKFTEQVTAMTNAKIAVYHADRTNLVDHAAHYSGGDVVYYSKNQLQKESDHILSYILDNTQQSKPPQTMLRGGRTPGDCWPMAGDQGWAVIKLRNITSVGKVSIEHVPAAITPTPTSAPKHVRVWGIKGTSTPIGVSSEGFVRQGTPLCELEYSLAGPPIQTVLCEPLGEMYKYVGLEILSNHGGDHTCIYRFRVHNA